MSLPGGVDSQTVAGAGAIATVAGAIAWPLWRRWMARTLTETDKSTGEQTWMKRQATELDQHKQMVAELLRLRSADAEVIAALRLEKALAAERMERMLRRMARMEAALIELKPEFAAWIRSDFAELPVYDPPLTRGMPS